MKRRVDIKGSHSELVMVKDQYEIYIEEHLRVSNRNPRIVGLDGYNPLSVGQYRMCNSVLIRVVIFYDKLGGTAKL